METEQRADGTLSDTPLPDLLASIAADRMDGVLRISDGSEIWFSGGRTYLATTATSADLAKVLFDGGVCSQAEINQAMAAAHQATEGDDTPSAADRLVADHPEAEPTLQRIVQEFTLNSLFEMLVPSAAEFRFERSRFHPIGARFAQDTNELVAQAQHRLEIWRRIAARIPSTAAVFALAPRLPGGVDQRLVTADEWRFLALLDGTTTVADIINETGESAFKVCSSLYRLLLENLVTEAEVAES